MPGLTSSKFHLRAWVGLLALLWAGCVSGPAQRASGPLPWAVYYSAEQPEADLSRFSLLIFDSDHHPPLGSRPRPVTLAYLSLGEVDTFRPYFAEVRNQGLLAGVNPNWGSHFVDLRDPRWRARVLDELLPPIIAQGFDGVLLDTLDSALYLETQDPRKYGGMQDAAARLVRAIRARYPGLLIAMNRAYPLLPQVEDSLDYVLAESMYGTYDFKTEKYKPVRREESRDQLALLRAARLRRPQLQILTLDYWDPEDRQGIEKIYRRQAANGFHPYVATIKLDRIAPEPPRGSSPAVSRAAHSGHGNPPPRLAP